MRYGGTSGIYDRHSRSIPILGEEGHESLANSLVVVSGIGAVGSPLLEILIRQGVGNIVAIDPDLRVENHNLDRQFLFCFSHIGMPKVLAAKEAAENLNPDVNFIPYLGTFSNAVKSSLREIIEQADVLVSAIDNRLGRYSVARFAHSNNIPHLDGATGEFNCRAYMFTEPYEGPCLLCTFTRKDYQLISEVFSCTRRVSEQGIAPAITQTGVQVANILAMETVKYLTGLPVKYNEIRVNLQDWKIVVDSIEPSSGHKEGHISC